MWDDDPPRGKITVFSLARKLEVPAARIMQIIAERLPHHPRLAMLNPNSIIGVNMAEVIHLTILQSPRGVSPGDPQDINWIG